MEGCDILFDASDILFNRVVDLDRVKYIRGYTSNFISNDCYLYIDNMNITYPDQETKDLIMDLLASDDINNSIIAANILLNLEYK